MATARKITRRYDGPPWPAALKWLVLPDRRNAAKPKSGPESLPLQLKKPVGETSFAGYELFLRVRQS